jgi:hypothetical protein
MSAYTFNNNIVVKGGFLPTTVSLSSTTDATSATSGGAFTSLGGGAIAKKLFVGSELSIGPAADSLVITNYTQSVADKFLLSAWAGTTNTAYFGLGSTAYMGEADAAVIVTTALKSIRLCPNGVPRLIVTSNGTVQFLKSDYSSATSVLGTSTDGTIISVATTGTGDIVRKSYADSTSQGLDTKPSVRVATTGAESIALSFYVGNTIDGIELVGGYRVLVKNQTNPVENGIYVISSSVLTAPTRSSDFEAGSMAAGAFVFVEQGTVNADSGWVCTTDQPNDIVGTNSLSFIQFSSAGVITAGTGLTKTGNVLSVNAIQTQITQLGVITVGTWNADLIAVANGGTGAASFTANKFLVGNGTGSIFPSPILTHASDRITVGAGLNSISASTGALIVVGGAGISGDVVTSGNIKSTNSSLGINLNGVDRPFITRAFDLFTSGNYDTLGRWGVFMEPGALTFGIPNNNNSGTKYQFATYNDNSAIGTIPMTIESTGIVRISIATASTSVTTGSLVVTGGTGISGNLYVGGDLNLLANVQGISLPGIDNAIITRKHHTFVSGTYAGIGSWGLFMEPSALTLGIPSATVHAPGVLQFVTYNNDSTFTQRVVISNTGIVTLLGGTASTSASTGALVINGSGGAGIGGNLNVGGTANITGAVAFSASIASNSTTTGTLVVTGGIGASGSIYSGGIGVFTGALRTNSTTDSTDTTTGALIVAGGTGIAGAVNIGGVTKINATTLSFGTGTGALVVAGDVGIGGKVNIGGLVNIGGAATVTGALTVGTKNITPNADDITAQTTFVASDTVLTPANVTGLLFPPASTRGFKVLMTIVVNTTVSLYEIQGVWNGTLWYLSTSYVANDVLVVFSITAGGQIQYTSGDYIGASITMKFKARTIAL